MIKACSDGKTHARKGESICLLLHMGWPWAAKDVFSALRAAFLNL